MESIPSLELKLDQFAAKVQPPPGLDAGKVRCCCAQSSLRAMEERLGVLEQVFVLVGWEEVKRASARLSFRKPGLEFEKIVEPPRHMKVENVIEKVTDMPMDEKVKTHLGRRWLSGLRRSSNTS